MVSLMHPPPKEQLRRIRSLNPLAPGEEIEARGFSPAVDEVDGLVQTVIGDDGQNGPENLLPMGLEVPSRVSATKVGGNPSAVRVGVVPVAAAVQDLLPRPVGPGDGYSACG